MEGTITQKQGQGFGRVLVRYDLRCTPEEEEEFLATETGQKIHKKIQEYKAEKGYK